MSDLSKQMFEEMAKERDRLKEAAQNEVCSSIRYEAECELLGFRKCMAIAVDELRVPQ